MASTAISHRFKIFKHVNEKYYWYKVLNLFERKGYFWNGLTIPFLIGSRLYIEPTRELQTINDFISDVNSSNCYLSILNCPEIGEYIFSLSSVKDKEIYGGFDNLVVIDDSFFNAKNSSDVINELEIRYTENIMSGMYSKTEGLWGAFTDKEIIRLKEAAAVKVP